MSLPLHTRYTATSEALAPGLYKVLALPEALEGKTPLGRTIIDLRIAPYDVDLGTLATTGIAAVITDGRRNADQLPNLTIASPAVVATGDVIRLHNGQLSVLYRRGANANTLFITDRCNSRCIMCSQPPRGDDDSWRIRELHELISLIDENIDVLGVSGGEPTLIGAELARLFSAARTRLARTTLHVLTNGRTFADPRFASLFDASVQQAVWAIPLYADTAALHDFIVQAPNAFNETVHGIYNLAERDHRIEIRCVVQRGNIDRLSALSEFIYRNMPFVEHVAFMGLEPMGYAKVNCDRVWIDPADFEEPLHRAVDHLDRREMAVSIYNVPLCTLKPSGRRFARQSISDWKNVYTTECGSCVVREQCCGFFQSAGTGWRSRAINSIREVATVP